MFKAIARLFSALTTLFAVVESNAQAALNVSHALEGRSLEYRDKSLSKLSEDSREQLFQAWKERETIGEEE